MLCLADGCWFTSQWLNVMVYSKLTCEFLRRYKKGRKFNDFNIPVRNLRSDWVFTFLTSNWLLGIGSYNHSLVNSQNEFWSWCTRMQPLCIIGTLTQHKLQWGPFEHFVNSSTWNEENRCALAQHCFPHPQPALLLNERPQIINKPIIPLLYRKDHCTVWWPQRCSWNPLCFDMVYIYFCVPEREAVAVYCLCRVVFQD